MESCRRAGGVSPARPGRVVLHAEAYHPPALGGSS